MTCRNLLAGTAMAALTLGLGLGPALADPINLDGYSGPLTIKFQNYESFGDLADNGSLQVGSTNFGVFQITSITAGLGGSLPFGTPLWSPGGANGFLVGTFDNIKVSGILPAGGGGFDTENTGGNFALYQVAAFPNFALGTGAFTKGGCANTAGCYTGISGGTNVLSWNLIPGADIVNAADTLFATITALSVPVNGTANGFGDIVGGTDAGQFATGGYTTALGTPADLQFADRFCPNPTTLGAPTCNGVGPLGVGNWANLSEDPVGVTVRAPEPASLALLGAGLLGLGVMRRRRRKV